MGSHEFATHISLNQTKPPVGSPLFKIGPHETDEKMRLRTIMDQQDVFTFDGSLLSGDTLVIPGLAGTESRDDAVLLIQAEEPVTVVVKTPVIGSTENYLTPLSVDGSGLYLEYDTNDWDPAAGGSESTGTKWAYVRASGTGSITARRVYDVDIDDHTIAWETAISGLGGSDDYYIASINHWYGKTLVLSGSEGFDSVFITNQQSSSVSVKIALVGGMSEDA